MKFIGLSILLAVFVSACSRRSNDVSVSRGEFNQVSIRTNDSGPLLFEEQGYQVAKDRFLQMDILRRLPTGRMAELFGEKAAIKDRFMIAIGLREAAKNSAEKVRLRAPEAYRSLEAYSRGVNRYLSQAKAENGALVDTYRRWTRNQNYQPEEWQPSDSIAVAEAIAFYLSSGLTDRLFFGRIGMAFGPERMGDALNLFDFRAIENVFILDSDKSTTPSQVRGDGAISKKLAIQNIPLAGITNPGFPCPDYIRKSPYGSNNWVVSRGFAGGKEAFLANDPHLPLSFPTNFVEFALESNEMQVRGVNLAGVPGVLIGHNNRIAWGLTNQPADVDDVYIDELSSDEMSVKFKGEWVPLRIKDEPLIVRGQNGEAVERTVRLRWVPHHGPIISDHVDELGPQLPLICGFAEVAKCAITYKWVGHGGTTELAAIMGVNRAQNFDEFKAALQQFQVGSQNFVYADVDGNIGYYSHGDYPIRKYLGKSEFAIPSIPLKGNGNFEWEPEFRKNIPELFNPATGRIVTANNDPFGDSAKKFFDGYRDYFGSGFASGIRAKRITQLLDENRGNVTLDTIKKVQTDHKDLLSLRFVHLASRLNASDYSQKALSILTLLKGWDGLAEKSRYEPVIADSWLRAMVKIQFQELYDLGGPELTEGLFGSTLAAKTLYHKLNEWTLSGRTVLLNKAKDLLNRSLEMAYDTLPNRPSSWGQMNRLQFLNPLEGIFPPMVTAPLERDGSWETVDVAASVWGPNFRLIMVLKEGEPITGVNVIAGGNYNPLESTLWMKELEMWRDGQYRPLTGFIR